MNHGKQKRKVVLLNTGEVFESITLASKSYDVPVPAIIMCCKGRLQSAGGKLNNKPMVWKYYDEINTDYVEPINKHKTPVILTNTNRYFSSVTEASITYGVDKNSIRRCCLGQLKSAGKFSSGEKLVWKYPD